MRASVAIVVIAYSLAGGLTAQAAPFSKSYDAPAGKETYVGDVPMMGEACFRVVAKATNTPAYGHFRGVINGRPIDLDRHNGGRCLNFVRDVGLGEYRVYVLADDGRDLTITRTVEGKGQDWRPTTNPIFDSPRFDMLMH